MNAGESGNHTGRDEVLTLEWAGFEGGLRAESFETGWDNPGVEQRQSLDVESPDTE